MKHRTTARTARTARTTPVLLGATLVVGLLAPSVPVNAHARTQAAALAAPSTSSFAPTTLTQHGGRNDQELGSVLNSTVCDVDGNGMGDVTARGAVALGGTEFADMAAHRREAGHADSLTDLPQWTSWTTDGPTGFTCAGDVNGDGLDDLVEVPAASARVVAVEQSTGSRNAAGRLEQNRVLRHLFPSGTTQLGARALGAAGDVDGDGAGDVLVSQHTATLAGRVGAGRVWVLRGRSGPTVPSSVTTVDLGAADSTAEHVALTVTGAAAGDRLGAAVGVGDLTGDGIGDLAVASERGSVWLLNGRAPGAAARDIDLAELDPADGHLWVTGATGLSQLAAGDVDGDGSDDLVIGLGADLDSDGGVAVVDSTGRGRLVTVDLAAGTVRDATGPRGHLVRAERVGDALGHAVAVPGDLDGDGRDDLLVGAPGHDPVEPGTSTRRTDAGAAYVIAGRDSTAVLELSGLTADQGHRVDGTRGAEQGAGRFGSDVAALGDVDGNGSLDFAVSAPGRSAHPTYRQGAVTVALTGELATGLDLRLARRAGDDGVPVGSGEVLRAADVLDLRANLRLATGQGVAGDVQFRVDGRTVAESTTVVSAPHRSLAFAEELRLDQVGEHEVRATTAAVPGRRSAAASNGLRVLVTDDTRTSVQVDGDTVRARVITAAAGTAVTDGTVTFVGADGTVVAADVPVRDGVAEAVVRAGSTVGVRASYGGHEVAYEGARVELLSASSAVVAPPAPQRVTLTLAKQKLAHGSAPRATLVLERAVNGTVDVLVDGRVVTSEPLRGTRLTVGLPRTLAVGRHTVTVRTPASATVAAGSASTTVTVTKVTSGRVSASAARFRKGARPVVKVRVAKDAAGHQPVGTVTVRAGGKKYTVRLTAARRGVVRVKLAKRRTTTTAVVRFTPRSTSTRTTPKKVSVKVRPRG